LTVGGNLTANSGNGSVTQAGPLAVRGTTGIVAGKGNIKLNDPGNTFDGKLTTSGSDVSVVGQQTEPTTGASVATAVSQLASSMLASAIETQPGAMSQQSSSFNEVPNAGSAASAANQSSSPMASSDGTLVDVTFNIGANGPALRVVNGGVRLPENMMSFNE
jgi:hypothetical protein